MPRKRRIKSSLNCYHIIVRGINKEDIFFDDNDRRKFLKELIDTKEKYNYKILAYVLMPNHMHLVIKEQEKSSSDIMRSLLGRYAVYFNKKYERVGYVFQDRFYSKPIEDDSYMKNVIRYIHLNPEKAGIVRYEEYKWSSYQCFFQDKSNLISIQDVENIFSKEIEATKDFLHVFTVFHKEKSIKSVDEEYLEYEIERRLEDQELYDILRNMLGEQKLVDMHLYQKEHREKALMDIFKIRGTNCAQISRVTGINRKLISNCREKYLRIKKKENENK